ncbi:hypothetical protein As57867_003472, partial [Aphanomyces stellatus]
MCPIPTSFQLVTATAARTPAKNPSVHFSICAINMNISECIFNGCANPRVSNTTKCAFHKNRDKCRMTECHNQVYARGLCVRHGGKKQCAFEGCVGNARSGSFCCRHGQPSKKKLCDHHGCTRVAHANHKCVAHGGGRKCKVASCASHARQ